MKEREASNEEELNEIWEEFIQYTDMVVVSIVLQRKVYSDGKAPNEYLPIKHKWLARYHPRPCRARQACQ